MSRATASKFNPKVASQGLTKLSNISLQGLPERYPSSSSKYHRIVPRAMASSAYLFVFSGKRAFIAGVADDNGYGWAIAKALAAAGAEILVGTWVPDLNIFETSLRRGKFDNSLIMSMNAKYRFSKYRPSIHTYIQCENNNFCKQVTKLLLETSRRGYLAAISASSYSFISLLQYFLLIMNPGGASVSLTYIACERTITGYNVLVSEAGRKGQIRVNTISAGPLRSRAAKAVGFIEKMIDYSYSNAPLQKELLADEVGNTASLFVSPLASAVTGSVVYVDNGLNTMGLAIDSPTLSA
ncbi:unnamed protein product [Musa acuminata subsp. malaccensis]|uniref:(wild Malaysian banana) hypothetical protein n=1 Tax=Musa acuminata subsp. malaccensis TaxID=214687 RepID=A0A8D7AJW5_MUSAM|nr:unnamed protein product [Musa acuminata subsp. malaccensis]